MSGRRAALTGSIFVLRSGVPWEILPPEMGCGSGVNCWRRLWDWQEAGVWDRLHRALRDRLGEADGIDWSRALLDSASIAARRGQIRRSQPDGSRRTGHEAPHGVGKRTRLPLAVLLSGANRHDSVVFEVLLDAIPAIKTPAGQRRKRLPKLHADAGYDFPRCRQALTRRHTRIRISRKGVDSSERLGRRRWMIERILAWLNRFRRLTVRYQRRADIHHAFIRLGYSHICWNTLQQGF